MNEIVQGLQLGLIAGVWFATFVFVLPAVINILEILQKGC